MQTKIDFATLTDGLKERLTLALPGAIAHEPMRAMPVGNLRPEFRNNAPAKPGSVLILLYPEADSIRIPLTKRADYAGAHSGQISFPGGKREQGEDEIATALRESKEEIGLDAAEVEVLGTLTQFFVIPSNYIVTPVVAVSRKKPLLQPDNIEAVKIIECDLFDLIDDHAIHEKEIVAAKQFKMLAPYFEVEGEVVWGATAMMLNEFRIVVRELSDKNKNAE
jgi:8-oxo-dGTP pyrophosphatase MutT (NUDIX family)